MLVTVQTAVQNGATHKGHPHKEGERLTRIVDKSGQERKGFQTFSICRCPRCSVITQQTSKTGSIVPMNCF